MALSVQTSTGKLTSICFPITPLTRSRAKDKPQYVLGHSVVLAYMALFLLGGSVLLRQLLVRENKKRRNGERDNLGQGMSEEEKVHELGDKRADFLYTL